MLTQHYVGPRRYRRFKEDTIIVDGYAATVKKSQLHCANQRKLKTRIHHPTDREPRRLAASRRACIVIRNGAATKPSYELEAAH